MNSVQVVLGLDALVDMVKQSREQLKPYTLVNGVNGDELTVTPDVPSIGFVTVEVINQWED